MPDQSILFAEDINDALKDVVRVLGGLKAVGTRLRPELTADSAGTWLKDCLNPDRREKLDPQQVVWIMREGKRAGCHSLMHYLADESGYSRPAPVDPLDEAAELQRQAIAAVKSFEGIAKRLERVMEGK